MGRELNERDLQILKKLVPEMEELQNRGVDIEYMNILPPVANHHSRGVSDFEQRLKKLSVEDMSYLSDLILEGTEAFAVSSLISQRSSSPWPGKGFPAMSQTGFVWPTRLVEIAADESEVQSNNG